jgi:cell wall-associated NlpC family hydrolase
MSQVLDKEPARRYPSGTAFVTALAQALEGDYPPAAIAPPPVSPTMQVVQQRSVPWHWIAAAALILAVVLAGAAAISGMIDRPDPTALPGVAVEPTEAPTQVPAETPSDISPTGTSTSEPVPEPTDTPIPLTPTNTSPPSDAPGSLVTVQIPVADVRAKPDNTSELVTQVVMGEKVMLQGKQAGWYQITAVSQPSPKDPQGYPGWLQVGGVSLDAYEPEQVAIVMIPSAPVRANPAADASIKYNLSIDSRVAFDSADGGWVMVTLPDGNEGWLAREHVRLICSEGECPGGASGEADEPRPIEEILTTAMQFTGTPYLWGGASSTAFDCSGFVYRVFHANGITIPRDSRPMSQSGTWVEKSDLRPGDVVFTARGGASGQVSHCALYTGEGQVITTYGTDPIRIVTLDDARYRDDYWGARRYP